MNLIDEDFKNLESFDNEDLGPNLDYKNCVASCLGLATRTVDLHPQWYMITVNLPPMEKYKLNIRARRCWRDYKPHEQHLILSRVRHLLNMYETPMWSVYFEFTRDVNLHAHILIYYEEHPKNLYLDFMRFFGINSNNRVAIHVSKPIDNLVYVISYLTDKKEKDYQKSPYAPIYSNDWHLFKKYIDE